MHKPFEIYKIYYRDLKKEVFQITILKKLKGSKKIRCSKLT